MYGTCTTRVRHIYMQHMHSEMQDLTVEYVGAQVNIAGVVVGRPVGREQLEQGLQLPVDVPEYLNRGFDFHQCRLVSHMSTW